MRPVIVLGGIAALLTALAGCDRTTSTPSPAEQEQMAVEARLVDPEFFFGNVTCADVLPEEAYDCEIKIGYPVDGAFPYTCGASSGEIALDVYDGGLGDVFDWEILGTRDVSMYTVVKGGPDANGYDYRPDGASADEELHSPMNEKNGRYYGLSHISFCIQERPCELAPTLMLYESCDEAFDYQIALEVNGQPLPLPDADMDVDLVYDCGAGPVVLTEPVQPDGTIAIPVEVTTECAVTVTFVGAGDLYGCAAETSGTVTVFPEIVAEGELSQSCDGTYSWDTEVQGGSGSHTLLWSFDVTDGGVGSQATSTDASGTAVLASGPVAEASVEAQLQVTDGEVRDSAIGPLTCHATPVVQGILALRPVLVQLLPQTADGTCPADDVSAVLFDAVVMGGSGEWTYAWGTGGDADLDAVCEATTDVSDADANNTLGCSFGLGEAFCAGGDVTLTVHDDDPACAPASDDISATRTATLDVTPDP